MDASKRSNLSTVKSGLIRMVMPEAAAFRIREERPRDSLAREMLLDRTFGLERFAKTCEKFRAGRRPAEGLSFVAVSGGTIVGTLRFWLIEAGDQASLLLGPLAIDARHRSAGIGSALIRHGLDRAYKLGHGSVLLVGDAPYYGRFGFTRTLARPFHLPGPVDIDRFLGLELAPGALTGAKGRVVAAGLIVERRRGGEDRLAA